MIAIHPDYCFSFKQCRLQKADEALADAEKALEQSSQPTYLAAIAKGKALYLQGEFEWSLIYVAQAEKMHPSAEARRLFFKSTEVNILLVIRFLLSSCFS